MNLDNAIFLDYTMYNQDEYAEAVARYQDSYIVEGFQMLGNELTAGTLFFKGWHLTFDPLVSYIADPVEGQTIYMEMSSTLGSKEEGILSTTYVPGEVSATILQASAFTGVNTMPLYKFIGGEWVLLSNGRIDSINDTKADLSNNLILDGDNINVDNPLGLENTINETLQQLADEISALTGGGLTQTQADTRYERQLSINNEYTNEELIGMNMAMIIEEVRSNLEDSKASVIVGHGSQAEFSALKTAALELINEIYGANLEDGTVLNTINLRLETSYKGGLSGNQILSIGTNGGDVYYFQYDNWGTNYTTVNTDAFRALHMITGDIVANDIEAFNIDTDNIVANDIEAFNIDTDKLFIRSSDDFFIRGTMATETVTNGIDVFNIDYSNGVNLFNISRNASETLTGRQLRFYLRNRADGVIQQGLEVNGGDTAGVVHRAVGVNKRLAYASEVTRSLELQRSGLLIDISELEQDIAESSEAKSPRLTRTLSAKEELLKHVEEELLTLEANMLEATLNGEQEYDKEAR